MPKRLIAGNWKMNGLKSSLVEAKLVSDGLSDATDGPEVLICPPATLISSLRDTLADSAIKFGGQDCHVNASGAHTGDISAEMLADLGCVYGIVGHSERRADHGESSELVASKASALIRAGVVPIICIGETLEERKAGSTLAVLTTQLKGSVPDGLDGAGFVVAYEPVWAIGTGLIPELSDIEEAHGHLRKTLEEMGVANSNAARLLYGGSVKPSNAAEILSIANVNGALVGGASLKASDFLGIIRS